MSANLTEKQRQILEFIEDQVRECGCVPTQAEIGRRFGHKSPNATRQNLQLIEKKGFIKLLPGVPRGIRLIRPTKLHPMQVPLVGRIAAGVPILAEENIEDWLQLPDSLFPIVSGRFALRVEGDSMVGAGILDQDIAVIRKQQTAENGEIAAVRVGEEATLKRIEFYDEGLRLKAENSRFKTIEIPRDSDVPCQIEGVLEGVLRSMSKGERR